MRQKVIESIKDFFGYGPENQDSRPEPMSPETRMMLMKIAVQVMGLLGFTEMVHRLMNWIQFGFF